MIVTPLINRLIEAEGYSGTIYTCPSGKRTIGYGHNLDASLISEGASMLILKYYQIPLRTIENDKLKALETIEKRGINKDIAMYFLLEDIDTATDACISIFTNVYWDSFNDARKYAFIEMAFNLGRGGLSMFKRAIIAAKDKEWKKCAILIRDSLYYVQLPKRVGFLTGVIEKGVFE